MAPAPNVRDGRNGGLEIGDKDKNNSSDDEAVKGQFGIGHGWGGLPVADGRTIGLVLIAAGILGALFVNAPNIFWGLNSQTICFLLSAAGVIIYVAHS